jgi:DNA-binding PucR family transcriptional regulator
LHLWLSGALEAPIAGLSLIAVAALVPAAGGDTASAVTAAIRRLAPGLERDQLSLGISEASPVGGLSGALDQARYARAVAQRRGSGVRVVSAEGLTSSVLMLATVPDAVRRMFTSRVLGPVLEHDKRTDADLLGTLQAFLDCSCSWSRAAELLHLHVNTVRYRIERVEELTGRDLANIEDRVDMFLALRSLSPR